MDEAKITIVGAGIVGLAIASELSARYDDIILLEKHSTFGQETSSRNSEVIHSGIYYPYKSLKAELCVEGAEAIYDICDRNNIGCARLGKLIVASNKDEIKALEDLSERGKKNNVKGLTILDPGEIREKEPNVNAEAALFSPNSGIVDSHSLMKYFFNVAQNNGVLFAFNSELVKVEKKEDGFIVRILQGDYQYKSKVIVNCAGLHADSIAQIAGIDIYKSGYKLKFCKGSYFSYQKKSPVNMLIYPIPHEQLTGLGVHATLDLARRLRFGPDVEYIDSIDFRVDPDKKELFFKQANKILSGLEKEAFVPDMAGVRPKLNGPNEKVRDFIIKDETDDGLPGLINLIGIESPGLTAAPAIAKMVAGMIDEHL